MVSGDYGHDPLPLPFRIGPVEFGELGRMVAVRCPKEFAHIVQRAGGGTVRTARC